MSKNKFNTLQRQKREARKRLASPDIEFAMKQSIAIATYAAKVVWKGDATNPKLEAFICEMLKIWEALGDQEVKLQTILDSIEMESKIKIDPYEGIVTNLKRPK